MEPIGVAPERILFEIGSATKVFTGVLLAQAVVEGKVSLDSTLHQLLKDRKFSDPRVGRITLRQLATHTSGLPAEADDLREGADLANPYAHYDRTRLLACLSGIKLNGVSPFSRRYSNFGMGLLGDVLSQVYGERWDRLILEKVTRPLGMKDTVAIPDEAQSRRFAPGYRGKQAARPYGFRALAGAGSLKSTAVDMILFGEALIDPEHTPLKESIELLLRPQGKDGGMGLAISFYESDGRAFGHDGLTGGYSSVFEVLPKTKTIRVVLINNSHMSGRPVLAISQGKSTRYNAPERAVTEAELEQYEGVYAIEDSADFENARFIIVRRGNRLFGKLFGTPYLQTYLCLRPHKIPHRFFLREIDAEYQFSRADDQVKSLTLFQSGLEIHAMKTNGPIPADAYKAETRNASGHGRPRGISVGLFRLVGEAESSARVASVPFKECDRGIASDLRA